jgi:hypothetical protein
MEPPPLPRRAPRRDAETPTVAFLKARKARGGAGTLQASPPPLGERRSAGAGAQRSGQEPHVEVGDAVWYTDSGEAVTAVTVLSIDENPPPGEQPTATVLTPDGRKRETLVGRLSTEEPTGMEANAAAEQLVRSSDVSFVGSSSRSSSRSSDSARQSVRSDGDVYGRQRQRQAQRNPAPDRVLAFPQTQDQPTQHWTVRAVTRVRASPSRERARRVARRRRRWRQEVPLLRCYVGRCQ